MLNQRAFYFHPQYRDGECILFIPKQVTKEKQLPFMANSIQEKAREFALGYLTKEEQDTAFAAFCEGYRLGFKDKVQRDDWDLSFATASFQPVLYEWICYRKEIKKSFKSIKSIQAAYKQLFDLSDGNPVIAMKIVEQSIASSWQGLFPLKQNDNNRNNFGKRCENGDSESLFSIANQLLQEYQ